MTPRYRTTVLLVAFMANFSQFGARLAVSPLVPDVTGAFGVTKGTVGLVLTSSWATFALMQYPSGVLADRYGERRIIAIAMGATAACSFLLYLSPSMLTFAVAFVALGAGAGLHFSVGTAMLSKLYEDTGGALGFHSSGAPLAGLVVPVAVATISLRYDWRTGFLLTGGIALVTLVAVLLVVEPRPPAQPDLPIREQFRLDTVLALVTRKRVAFSLLLASLGMYAFQSFVSFFPTFLEEFHGYGTQFASTLFGAAFVLSALSLPVIGRVSDRIGRDPTLVLSFSTVVAGLVGVTLGTGVVVFVGVALLGGGLSWGGVIQSRFMDSFSTAERGTGFGLSRTVFVLLGSVGNVITGVLAEGYGWTVAFGVVVGLLTIAVLALAANRLLGFGY